MNRPVLHHLHEIMSRVDAPPRPALIEAEAPQFRAIGIGAATSFAAGVVIYAAPIVMQALRSVS